MALTWDAVRSLSDDALERVARPGPDLVWMHTELRRPGVTLELLHLEYLAAHPDEYRYSAFCGHWPGFTTEATAPALIPRLRAVSR